MKDKTVQLLSCFLILLLAGCTTGLSKREMTERLTAARVRYSSTDWTVRKAAIEEAGKFTIPEAQTFLIRAAKNDTHAAVRSAAILGLTQSFPDETTFALCLDLAESDRSDTVRYDATRSLVQFKNPRAYELFTRKMQSSDWLVKEAAISGICQIEDPGIEQRSIPYIIQALRDTNMNVRIAALEHVRVQDKEIYNQIRKVFFTENYEYKITLLIATLKALQGYDLDIRVRERVEQLIVHPNKDVRIYALRVLKAEPAYQR